MGLLNVGGIRCERFRCIPLGREESVVGRGDEDEREDGDAKVGGERARVIVGYSRCHFGLFGTCVDVP